MDALDDRDGRRRVHRQPPGRAASSSRGERVRVVERPGADVGAPAGGRRGRPGRHPRPRGGRPGDARGPAGSTTWRRTRTSGSATGREFDAVNHRGTVHVLDAALDAGAERVLHTSTESILTCARPTGPIAEDVEVDAGRRRRAVLPVEAPGRERGDGPGPGRAGRWWSPTRRCRSGRATGACRRRPG